MVGVTNSTLTHTLGSTLPFLPGHEGLDLGKGGMGVESGYTDVAEDASSCSTPTTKERPPAYYPPLFPIPVVHDILSHWELDLVAVRVT